MNKKILFITAYFYPQNAIAVLRVGAWVKYLAKYGYEVDVLTTKKYSFNEPLNLDTELPDKVNVYEVDYLPIYLKKIFSRRNTNFKEEKNITYTNDISMYREIMKNIRNKFGSIIDIYDFWTKPGLERALELFDKKKYNTIISSYNPPASHKIAHKLKRKLNIKWIADFRDLWAYNHISPAKGFLGKIEKIIERKTLDNVDLIITVSDPLSDIMKKNYPSKNVITIENGFDPEEFHGWKAYLTNINPTINKPLNIVYTGSIYDGKRDPAPLVIAINELIKESFIQEGDIVLNFYGKNQYELKNLLRKYKKLNLNTDFIRVNGFLSREECLNLQKKADLLLFLEWNDPSAKGVLTGKIFEYILSGTPILGIGKDHEASRLIKKTGTGICSNNPKEIKSILKTIIQNKVISFYHPNIKEIEKYSRDTQIKKLIQYI